MEIYTPSGIKNLASKKGLTIAELCRRANVNNSIFTKWKNGSADPQLSTINKLISVLDPKLYKKLSK